jgi:hypothetical protein
MLHLQINPIELLSIKHSFFVNFLSVRCILIFGKLKFITILDFDGTPCPSKIFLKVKQLYNRLLTREDKDTTWNIPNII